MSMHGKVSHELEVRVPASIVWETYGTLELAKLGPILFPHVIEKADVLEGDGGVGTIVAVTLASAGTPGPNFFKEKFVTIDNENRVKVTETIEGGMLLFGFSLYRIILEIIDKERNTSIIRSSIEYEIGAGSSADPSMVSTQLLELMAEAVGKYLEEKHANVGSA